ncbi:hypothetical protein FKM82_022169 [Ascaphus truei]
MPALFLIIISVSHSYSVHRTVATLDSFPPIPPLLHHSFPSVPPLFLPFPLSSSLPLPSYIDAHSLLVKMHSICVNYGVYFRAIHLFV